jgi:hypothetical protein
MSTHAIVPEARMLLQWQAAEFLYREAKLLDDAMIKEWQALFTSDCHYWIPIDESAPLGQSVSLVNDNAIALDERIYHLLSTTSRRRRRSRAPCITSPMWSSRPVRMIHSPCIRTSSSWSCAPATTGKSGLA